MRHMVNIYVGFNMFAFRVSLLIDWLLYCCIFTPDSQMCHLCKQCDCGTHLYKKLKNKSRGWVEMSGRWEMQNASLESEFYDCQSSVVSLESWSQRVATWSPWWGPVEYVTSRKGKDVKLWK